MKEFIKNQYSFFKKNWKFILFIIYLLSPVDFIPDVITGGGLVDDLMFFIYLLLERKKSKDNPPPKQTQHNPNDAVEGEIIKY